MGRKSRDAVLIECGTREILFRGKEVSPCGFKRWRYGLIFKCNDTDTGNTLIMSADNFYTGAVYKDAVSQFTGLRDVKGKRIFEGDIIRRSGSKGEYASNYLVTFEEGCFMLVLAQCYCDKWQPRRPFPIFHDWKQIEPEGMIYKIIGNKWDMPQLLTGGKNGRL